MFPRISLRPRTALRLSPVVATAALTAAIFLLPATAHQRQAQASTDGITASPAEMTGDGPGHRH